MLSSLCRLAAVTAVLGLSSGVALAQPVPRPTPVAGSIVAAKGGEELRFVQEPSWRAVELRQDLIGGDALRTNTIGSLAILFADQTQIRVGRNSTLIVNEVASANRPTELELPAGNIWARASRGGSGVEVKTPAAVAAIRGTDWSLAVDGSGKTALVVLEGVVELTNPQGSVTVRQGEGAVAAIGQAPTKFVLVRPDDREQMLFHIELRDAFNIMPASPLEGPALRAERARVDAIPPAQRRAEDWLVLAETALSLDGRAVAGAALQEARQRPLNASQRARADLVDALLAGGERRWREAAALFARAEPRLDARRRSIAAYGRYIAASMADPARVQPAPRAVGGDANAAIAQTFVDGFTEDLTAAAKTAKAGEARHPRNARLAAFSGQLALALNRRDEMRAAVERARALDPDDPDVLVTSAMLKGEVDSDLDGALADLNRAAAIAPGRYQVWNALGLIQSAREAPLEAEAAFRRAIEVDPHSPVSYANLAILLLDQSRVEEAGTLIDKALEIDPAFHVAYIARGRYFLQKGDDARGIENLLAGSAANPAYSQGLLGLAIAYYHAGDLELSQQALDNADRLDPNDPVVSMARTAIAVDQYQADQAIGAARESIRRFRQRGGYYAPLATTRQGGSYLSQAYRLIGLDEWGRFYGDRVFDPFSATGYFDQAIARRGRPVIGKPTVEGIQGVEADMAAFNLAMQGLFFDPLAVSGRTRRLDLLRRPFVDGEIGGGLVSRDGKLGWQTDATIQGFSNLPIPTSFYANVGRGQGTEEHLVGEGDIDRGSFFLGAAPSAADRFLMFAAGETSKPGLTTRLPVAAGGDARKSTSIQAGAGWSHTFGYRNVMTAGVFATTGHDRRFRQRLSSASLVDESLGFPIFFDVTGEATEIRRTEVDGVVAAVNHTIGLGDVTFRHGIEVQRGTTKGMQDTSVLLSYRDRTFDGLLDFSESASENLVSRGDFRAGRAYADALWRPSDRFEAEVGIQGTISETESQLFPSNAPVTYTRDKDKTADPRIGAAFSPVEGQWFRAAYRRDTELPIGITLSPVTTVGLAPNPVPLAIGGRTETLAFRWDAEWHPRFFTAVEYQRQNVRNLDLPIIDTLDTLSVTSGRIDRVAATANIWLGYGIGVFGTVGAASSENKSEGADYGRPIPFVAERFARAGLTFVHPSRLKFTLAQTFIGDRTGDLAGVTLDDYWTTDAAVTWETPDRRLQFGLALLNMFDNDYELAPGIPGPGRTVSATMKARF